MLGLDEELRRIRSTDGQTAVPAGYGLAKIVADSEEAAIVVDRCRAVLEIALTHRDLSTAEMRALLPAWFVSACSDESDEEVRRWVEEWRALPGEEQAQAEEARRWRLQEWLWWLDPERREWYWWDSEATDRRTVELVVLIPGWPVPLGGLRWLLRAAGAGTIEAEFDRV